MSARAAWRLETLGFDAVYRYVGGKADWFAHGLPVEGRLAAQPTAGDVARRDVPTCALGDPLGEVHARVQGEDRNFCIVVTGDRVVLGRLRGEAWEADPQATVETAMEEGPTTIRPNTLLEDIVPRMEQRGVRTILVTDADGRLIGVLYRSAAARRLEAFKAAQERRERALTGWWRMAEAVRHE